MKRVLLSLGLAIAALGLTAPGARAADPSPFLTDAFCTDFHLCLSFDLTDLGSLSYKLEVTYTGAPDGLTTAQQGAVTAAGITDLLAEPGFTLTFGEILFVSGGKTWEVCGSNDLNPPFVLLCAAADAGNALANGLQLNEMVAFSFTSDKALAASDFTGAGELGFRAHVQSFGPLGCSLKPDSRADGHLVGTITADNWDTQCGGSTVPEPVSTVLLGTGLLFTGALLRRRHVKEVTGQA